MSLKKVKTLRDVLRGIPVERLKQIPPEDLNCVAALVYKPLSPITHAVIYSPVKDQFYTGLYNSDIWPSPKKNIGMLFLRPEGWVEGTDEIIRTKFLVLHLDRLQHDYKFLQYNKYNHDGFYLREFPKSVKDTKEMFQEYAEHFGESILPEGWKKRFEFYESLF